LEGEGGLTHHLASSVVKIKVESNFLLCKNIKSLLGDCKLVHDTKNGKNAA